MRWLVTGGCGFIGSHFIRFLLGEGGATEVWNLDLLTYAGNPENLSDVASDPRYHFVHGDVADTALVEEVLLSLRPEMLVHFAAESHVDRSLLGAWPFLRTNVIGTQVLLDAWKRSPGRRFVQVSTDEVYGSLVAEGCFSEDSPLRPSSPYAASKAAADLLVAASRRSFDQDVTITRSSNNLGPCQHGEKLVPKLIACALHDQPLPLYGNGQNVRDWLWVEDNVAAVFAVATRAAPGAVYNVGGGQERQNIEVALAVLDLLGKPRSLVSFVPDRPGHDRRYSLCCDRIGRELGWFPRLNFREALERTVRWYLDHPERLEPS
jgi:dTDP-glucose 4,6-dehydratase